MSQLPRKAPPKPLPDASEIHQLLERVLQPNDAPRQHHTAPNVTRTDRARRNGVADEPAPPPASLSQEEDPAVLALPAADSDPCVSCGWLQDHDPLDPPRSTERSPLTADAAAQAGLVTRLLKGPGVPGTLEGGGSRPTPEAQRRAKAAAQAAKDAAAAGQAAGVARGQVEAPQGSQEAQLVAVGRPSVSNGLRAGNPGPQTLRGLLMSEAPPPTAEELQGAPWRALTGVPDAVRRARAAAGVGAAAKPAPHRPKPLVSIAPPREPPPMPVPKGPTPEQLQRAPWLALVYGAKHNPPPSTPVPLVS